KIQADKDNVYCEICGDIVKRVQNNYNTNQFELYNVREEKSKFDVEITPISVQKKIKQHPDALKFPIGRIFYDDDFPITFKSNFVLVFSRLVAFAIMRFDQEGEFKLGKPEIPENSLNDLYMATRRIQEYPMKDEFLRDLRNISREDFKRHLKKLQAKIQANRQYLEHFHVYTRWLIRKVYLIVSTRRNELDNQLSKFDRALYKKLENQILFINKPSEYAKTIRSLTILELFEKIKRELEGIVPSEMFATGGLSEGMLGKLLGKSENHINYIKTQIRKYESKGRLYLLALDLLSHYKESLKSKFGENAKNAINIIDIYSNLNVLKKSSKRIHSHHPNLILDYFKTINTLEKAYWLGFLFADGFIEINGKRIAIELGEEDKELLYDFAKRLKFNKDYISYQKEHKSYLLRFQSEDFCNDLINLGMIPGETKSKNIELPSLHNRELYLAFLLGYFDGDGIQGTSRITSGSLNFLRQIKSRFNIEYSIDRNHMRLTLGANLLNEMLNNYKNSLPRKRIYLTINKRAKVINNLGIQVGNVIYTIDRLNKLLWEMPLYKITEKISQESGVELSDRTLAKYCNVLKLQRPDSGYWHQKKFLGKFN
ncbi:MAG: LAGLIDADG family homing endonuclease, partial [Candidatus Thorarchaeota archaeon]